MTQIQHAASAQSHATRKTILIVEDDPSIAEFLKMAIAQETLYHPLLAETGERAFEIVQHVKPSLFVLDHVLGFIRTHILFGSRELVFDRKSATLEEQRENLRRTVRPRPAIGQDRRQKTVPRLPGF